MARRTERPDSEAVVEALVRLKDRALSATAEGITIADARLADRPLIYVNAGFERLTGYPREAVLGRNCRYLQGAGTDADTVAEIREAIEEARECTVEILNYRRDGTPFWNRLSITPVRDDTGEVTHFIGVQSDVSERRRAEDDLRRAKSDLEAALSELRRDLELAAKIQQSLLPKRKPAFEGVEVAWLFRPCAHLAGDFLNVFGLDDEHVALYVLDVSGHGASAALLSVTLSRWLSPTTPSDSCLFLPRDGGSDGYRIARPGEVATRLNQRFQIDTRRAQYFTLIYGILNLRTRRFDYVAAGHPGPILVTRGAKATSHGSTAPPIGLLPSASFDEASLDLATGDRLYLYTDGLTEAADARDEAFGEARVCQVLADDPERDLEASLQGAVDAVERWRSAASSDDDVSLLAIGAV